MGAILEELEVVVEVGENFDAASVAEAYIAEFTATGAAPAAATLPEPGNTVNA